MKMENQMSDAERDIRMTVAMSVPKPLKRAPGLGRLNRLVASTSEILVKLGHDDKRFKRSYDSGIAAYRCPGCGKVAAVGLGQGRGETYVTGDALESPCSKSVSQK